MMNRRQFLGAGSLALLAAGCQSTCCSTDAAACGKKVPFKFGMAGYTFHRCSVDETLKYMKQLDVHYLCIKDFHLPYAATAAEIKAFHRKCADHGVTGYGVGPIYMKKGEARKYFDYAKAVGVKVLVAVPFEDGEVNGKKTRVGSRACCETLSELCREYGDIRIAIHNHGPDIPYCFPTGDSAFEMVKDLDPRVGLCLDIGHNFRAGLDPAASIRKLHTRIFDMHVKNVKFDAKKNLAVPMPRGDMKLPEVVKALCEVGYTGCCSLEYESFPAKGVRPGIKYDDIAESVGYFQGLMKAAENV